MSQIEWIFSFHFIQLAYHVHHTQNTKYKSQFEKKNPHGYVGGMIYSHSKCILT